MTDLRQQIAAALKDFETYPLPEAATRLFATLGYRSDRTLPILSVAEFCRRAAAGRKSGEDCVVSDRNEQPSGSTDFELVTWLEIK